MSTPSLYSVTHDFNVAAASADDRYFAVPLPRGEWLLDSAMYVPAAALALDGTDYTTLSVLNGATTLGSIDNSATAFVQGTPVLITLSGGTALEFTAQTDAIELQKAETGSGSALNGSVTLSFTRLS